MIDGKQATALVEKKTNEPDCTCRKLPRLEILDDRTIEREWEWVSYCITENYIKSGSILDSLAANAPYIVNNFAHELIETRTACDIEDDIEEHESKLQKHTWQQI